MNEKKPTNPEIADILERIANLLEAQGANPHRVRAYRNGARRIKNAEQSIAALVRDRNGEALQRLPDIGEGLARVISRFVHTGRSAILDRLQGEVSPETLFSKLPGIGSVLAERIVEQLDVETLEELEQAAHDGRLDKVEGFGPKRVQSVRVSLAGILSRAAQRRTQQRSGTREKSEQDRPAVATLLKVDAEYRRKAEAGKLNKIAPRRFNPAGEAWLPILHTSQNDWDFTALYSNTALAHELNRTHDWVVIYYDRNGNENQATVVTATHGSLNDQRIVRGREVECERYYQKERVLDDDKSIEIMQK